MGAETLFVANVTIACHLGETKLPRPTLRRFHQLPSEPLTAQIRIYVLAFDIADTSTTASFCIVSHSSLQKTAQPSLAPINHESGEVRVRFSEKVGNLRYMLVRRGRPE